METSTDNQHPRHFWRRIVAYCIDATLCWLIVAVLFAIFGSDDYGEKLSSKTTRFTVGVNYEISKFRPPFTIATTTCGVSPEISPAFQSLVAPETVASLEMCFDRKFGLPTSGTAILVLNETDAAAETAAKRVTIPLSLKGVVRFADVITFGLFLVCSIFCLQLFQTTPGKKLMGLWVTGSRPLHMFRREIIRNAPTILFVAVVAVLSESVKSGWISFGIGQPVTIGIQILAVCAMIALWIWPMLQWRGAMLHDKWSGLVVQRSTPKE